MNSQIQLLFYHLLLFTIIINFVHNLLLYDYEIFILREQLHDVFISVEEHFSNTIFAILWFIFIDIQAIDLTFTKLVLITLRQLSGVIVGLIFGYLLKFPINWSFNDSLNQIAMTLTSFNLLYYICRLTFRVNGCVAIVTCCVVIYFTTRITDKKTEDIVSNFLYYFLCLLNLIIAYFSSLIFLDNINILMLWDFGLILIVYMSMTFLRLCSFNGNISFAMLMKKLHRYDAVMTMISNISIRHSLANLFAVLIAKRDLVHGPSIHKLVVLYLILDEIVSVIKRKIVSSVLQIKIKRSCDLNNIKPRFYIRSVDFKGNCTLKQNLFFTETNWKIMCSLIGQNFSGCLLAFEQSQRYMRYDYFPRQILLGVHKLINYALFSRLAWSNYLNQLSMLLKNSSWNSSIRLLVSVLTVFHHSRIIPLPHLSRIWSKPRAFHFITTRLFQILLILVTMCDISINLIIILRRMYPAYSILNPKHAQLTILISFMLNAFFILHIAITLYAVGLNIYKIEKFVIIDQSISLYLRLIETALRAIHYYYYCYLFTYDDDHLFLNLRRLYLLRILKLFYGLFTLVVTYLTILNDNYIDNLCTAYDVALNMIIFTECINVCIHKSAIDDKMNIQELNSRFNVLGLIREIASTNIHRGTEISQRVANLGLFLVYSKMRNIVENLSLVRRSDLLDIQKKFDMKRINDKIKASNTNILDTIQKNLEWMTEKQVFKILNICQVYHFFSNDYIIRHGNDTMGLYYVFNGTLSWTFRPTKGLVRRLKFFGILPNCVFFESIHFKDEISGTIMFSQIIGETAILTGRRYYVDIVAKTNNLKGIFCPLIVLKNLIHDSEKSVKIKACLWKRIGAKIANSDMQCFKTFDKILPEESGVDFNQAIVPNLSDYHLLDMLHCDAFLYLIDGYLIEALTRCALVAPTRIYPSKYIIPSMADAIPKILIVPFNRKK
ncbi:hypothetical protein O3M35_000083 [Rhynocoris fuscipes]|uniref:Cyclic nucleotide-binding domain-containing protein n=1 Tax=Rhynocoris fuscipes TaxID=488301 RepID=A0AAW1DKH0_9HEMI